MCIAVATYSMLAEELQNNRMLYHVYSSVPSISSEQEDFLRNPLLPIRIVAVSTIVNVKKERYFPPTRIDRKSRDCKAKVPWSCNLHPQSIHKLWKIMEYYWYSSEFFDKNSHRYFSLASIHKIIQLHKTTMKMSHCEQYK